MHPSSDYKSYREIFYWDHLMLNLNVFKYVKEKIKIYWERRRKQNSKCFLNRGERRRKNFSELDSEGRKKDLSQSIWKACRSKTVLLVSSNDFIEISSLLKRKYFKYFFFLLVDLIFLRNNAKLVGLLRNVCDSRRYMLC